MSPGDRAHPTGGVVGCLSSVRVRRRDDIRAPRRSAGPEHKQPCRLATSPATIGADAAARTSRFERQAAECMARSRFFSRACEQRIKIPGAACGLPQAVPPCVRAARPRPERARPRGISPGQVRPTSGRSRRTKNPGAPDWPSDAPAGLSGGADWVCFPSR